MHLSGPDIFISYAHEDAATARIFADAFAAEGLEVWWDNSLQAGEVFDEAIEAALRAARAVAVLWSPHSVQSRWVRAEATLADRNRTLIPAMIAPCERPIIFELTHTADLTGWEGDRAHRGWQAFAQDVLKLVARGKEAEAEAAPQPASVPAKVELGRPSLAIMPFANRSGEASDELFAAGMVEDLIAALSTGRIKVISSSSTRTYKDVAYDVRQVGETLGVRYLLEGNVRRAGDNFRVTAQIAEAESGEILWTGKFDRPLADIAALQEDLVIEAAAQLGVQIERMETERALKKPGDLTAWEMILRAAAGGLNQTPESVIAALEYARKAVQLAPDFGAAHTALAMAASIAFWQISGSSDEALREEARQAARTALKLEPNDPRVMSGAAQTFCTIGQWRDGLRCAERAYAQAPELEVARHTMVMVCVYYKRAEEALAHLDACDRLAPRSLNQHIRLIQRSGCHFMLGEWEKALNFSEQALISNPAFTFALKDVVIYLEKLGRREEALDALAEFREAMPHATLEFVERLHRGSLLAPDVAQEMYETFVTVWRAAEETAS